MAIPCLISVPSIVQNFGANVNGGFANKEFEKMKGAK